MLAIAVLLAPLVAIAPSAQGVIYVDDTATGSNNGTSWADAFTDLQDALAIAGPDNSVWVAEGVYRPATDLNRTKSLIPKAPVYGGFAGHETHLEAREGLFDRTILTGDLADNDGPGFAGNEENSFHVVRGVSAGQMLLDGFTITGGNANNPASSDYLGGGVLVSEGIDGGSLTLRNCRVVANYAFNGGGLCGVFGPPDGVRLEDCLFMGNAASSSGAGVALILCPAVIERSWFLGNKLVPDDVGALGGGGLGGGLYGTNSRIVLSDCVFSGNSTDGGAGGAVYADALIALRSTFYRNSAAGSFGGGIYSAGAVSCSKTVADCILWGNTDKTGFGQSAQIMSFGSLADPAVYNSCVQGWTGLPCSGDVIGLDPLFVNPDGPDGIAGTLDDDLELSADSPCIDRGRAFRMYEGSPASLLDAARRRRHVDLLSLGDGLILDLGALERPAGSLPAGSGGRR